MNKEIIITIGSSIDREEYSLNVTSNKKVFGCVGMNKKLQMEKEILVLPIFPFVV